MKVKKIGIVFLACLLAMSLLLVACGKDPVDGTSDVSGAPDGGSSVVSDDPL